MSRHWREPFDPEKHRDHMWVARDEAGVRRDPVLDPGSIYFVEVCGFTFEFHSLGQIDVCLDYFSQRLHASSRINWEEFGGDHGEAQSWFERLPQRLLDESKRVRVVDALKKARADFATGRSSR